MSSARKRKPRLAQWLLCYALFVVVLILAYLLFTTSKNAVSAILYRVTADQGPNNQFTVGSGYEIYTLLIGLAMFVVVLAAEPAFRTVAGQTNRLVKRFLRFSVPLAVLIVISMIVTAALRH